MAKEKNPEVTSALEQAVDKIDLDGVLYRLSQIAYKKRNEQDHKDGNRAEHDWWHAAGGILADAVDKIGGIK